MRLKRLTVIILLVIIFFLSGEIDEGNFTIYRSPLDTYSGFYSVINDKTEEPSQYENHTLNINIGDKIIWVNRDTDVVTIISDQGLWANNNVILVYRKQFNYTFFNPGIYTFYIDRYKKLSKQTIIVSDSTNKTVTIEPTPTMTTSDIVPTEPTPTMTTSNIDNYIDDNDIVTIEDDNYIASTNSSISKDNIQTSILIPLDIFSNFKLTGIISFVMIIIISFVRDIIRKNGENI